MGKIREIYKRIQSFDSDILRRGIALLEDEAYPYKIVDNDDNNEYIDEIIDLVIELMVKNENDENSCEKQIVELGVDRVFASVLIGFSKHYSGIVISCMLLNTIDLEQYRELCLFLLRRVVLTNDFANRKPKELFDLVGELDRVKNISATNYLLNHMLAVSNRRILPDTLKRDLIENTKLNEEKIRILIDLIEENLNEMYQAALFGKLEEVQSSMSLKLSDFDLME